MAKRVGKKTKTTKKRRIAAGVAGLRGRIKHVEAERDTLRQALAAKDEQLGVLSERVDRLSSREADLRALLLAAHERLTGEQSPTRGGNARGGNGASRNAVVSSDGATKPPTYRQLVA